MIFKFADIFKEASGSVKSLDTKQERKNSSPQPTSPSIPTPASSVVQNGSANTINRSSSVNSGGSSGSTNQEVQIFLFLSLHFVSHMFRFWTIPLDEPLKHG